MATSTLGQGSSWVNATVDPSQKALGIGSGGGVQEAKQLGCIQKNGLVRQLNVDPPQLIRGVFPSKSEQSPPKQGTPPY